MNPLHELIEQYDTDLGDPAATAEKVMKALKLNQHQSDMLGPVITDEVRRSARSRVRKLERQAGLELRDRRGASESQEPVNVPSARELLLQKGFTVEGGRYVLWGEATVADHESRIALLDKNRKGLGRTIKEHRDAIRQIEAAGVTCLLEVPEAA